MKLSYGLQRKRMRFLRTDKR